MPAVVADDSTMAEQIRYRNPRNPEKDPNSNRSKSTISSILTSSPPNDSSTSKKKSFSSAIFIGLGCAASSQVSVPAVIRKSADWEARKLKKKRLKTKKISNDKLIIQNNSAASSSNPPSHSSLSLALSSSCVGVPDVWCGPGMGLSIDAASVDCVDSRRPVRGKVDGLERIILGQRERPYTVRRMVSPEDNPFLELDAPIGIAHVRSDVSGPRHNRYIRHGSREGLAEIVMLQNDQLMGGRLNVLDRYRDLRLDVDNMSYEELLELGERIGYVKTGLGEHEIARCLRRSKIVMLDDLSLHFASDTERKCSICQEEYEGDDETGRLICGHSYHIYCIKQWLRQKNSCPVCKTSVVAQPQAE